MTDCWPEIREIFAAAADRPPAERAAFLEAACGGNPAVRREVAALLELIEPADRMFETPWTFGSAGVDEPDDLQPGERLGAYRIERRIGRGGMGTVYLADRADEQFRKRVAIKVVRPGLGGEMLVRRFRTERQILAELEHPNIARLLDGGETREGLPFLVMEHVEGEPIDEHCEKSRLDVAGRLRLFRKVCAAVQYAHERWVIHRDLKPGNILVTAEGEPKLLDFGIAKLVEPDAGGGAHTGGSLLLLTPAYASPEQMRGEPASAASDLYSLGVVLYELLSGRRPYPVSGSGSVEVRPRLPAGDLNNITRMALEKDPARRYGSVQKLSEDLGRYLEGRPVLARAQTPGYRGRKFLARHKTEAAAAIALAVGLAGAGFTIWRERHRAPVVRASRLPEGNRQQLQASLAAQLARHGEAHPESVRLLRAMGLLLQRSGDYAGAETQLRRALTGWRRLPPEAAGPLEVRTDLAFVLTQRGDYGPETEALLRESLAASRRGSHAPDARTGFALRVLGHMYDGRGDIDRAAQYYRETIETFRRLPEAPAEELALPIWNLAVLHRFRREHGEEVDGTSAQADEARAHSCSDATTNRTTAARRAGWEQVLRRAGGA
jgi:tRNA A-37 threonylcarbamoyl transferase component Bud32/tetratricopeptide (TPR) repeat protein